MTLPPRFRGFIVRVAANYARIAELFFAQTLFLYVLACIAARTPLGLHAFIEFIAYLFRFHPARSAG